MSYQQYDSAGYPVRTVEASINPTSDSYHVCTNKRCSTNGTKYKVPTIELEIIAEPCSVPAQAAPVGPNAGAAPSLGEMFAKASAWISVKERLPDGDGAVVCLSCDGLPSVCRMNNGKWACDKSIEYDITHWMPLPDPPQEAKS